MTKDNNIRSNLEKDITKARSKYPYQKHSFGSRMNMIADPIKYLNRELKPEELRLIGDDLSQIQRDDFLDSLYPALKEILFLYSDKKISLPGLDNFQNFKEEYELIKYLVLERSLSSLKLDDLAFTNVHSIRNFPETNGLKNMTLNPIDVNLLDLKIFGINGFISMREKGAISSIEKLILEDFDFKYPTEKELKNRGFLDSTKSLEYCQKAAHNYAIGLEEGALSSSQDIYEYFVPYFDLMKDDTITLENIKALLNRYFIDYVGGLIVAPREMILNIDKQLRKGLGDKLNRLEFRTKDYLREEVKNDKGEVIKIGTRDHSITHAFNGNSDRCAVEIKLIPISLVYNAYMGEDNHPGYKLNQKRKLAWILKNHSEYNEKFANLCYARNVKPQQVLGPLHLLPKHVAYEKLRF